MSAVASVDYTPMPEQGYVLKATFYEDGTMEQERIPYVKPGPGTIRMARNYATAQVEHTLDGRRTVDDEVVDKRFAICEKCPSKLYQLVKTITLPDGVSYDVGRCTDMSCGCALAPAAFDGKNKLRWAEQRCPNNHWSRVE